MNPLTRYYIHQADGGGGGSGGGVGPIYSVPFFVQGGHGLGSFWAEYFGRFDLFFPAYALLAKLWIGRH